MAYAALVERQRFTLRRVWVPALAPGSEPLRILHISDLHMTARQHRKQEWVRGLDRLNPDLVITTGDNLAAHDAVGATLTALEPLLDRPGAFVFGSNDYFAPTPKNPVRYLLPRKSAPPPTDSDRLPWPELRSAMLTAGWADLSNRRDALKVGRRIVAVGGVDDPHIRRDRYERIAGRAEPDADLRIGVTHSPEPRILTRFAADRYELILAGHTHGGQLRLPGYGALITNCALDRGRCRGLSRWGASFLHVSAGLGTSPYAPVRFACLPEATLITVQAPDH